MSEFDTIYLISHRDLLKGRSDCVAVMRMAYAFSKLGFKTVVIMPYFFRKENVKLSKVWEYYGIEKNSFKIKVLPTPLWDDAFPNLKRVLKLLFHSVFSIFLFFKFLFSGKKRYLIYMRGVIECVPYLILGKFLKNKVYLVYDLHAFRKENFILKKILKNSHLVVSISKALKEELLKFVDIDEEKILVFGMGIPEDYLNGIEIFSNKSHRLEMRRKLGIPLNSFVVTYTGKIYIGQKEVELIIETAKILPDVYFLLIGGKEKVVKHFMEMCERLGVKNVIFKGFLPPSEVLIYQRVSDVLLLFYTRDIPTFNVCSPSKLFEYMASNVPIICVNSPSLSEIIRDGENGLLVEPEDVVDLSKKIKRIKEDRALGEKLASNALKDVENYTFEKRAKKIIEKISGSIESQ